MDFLTALGFLTTLPLPNSWRMVTPDQIGRSLSYFPLAGLVIGGILVGVDRALGFVFPPLLGSALVVVALVIFIGGLHLDGLADTCDALAVGKTPEERLKIMRDSRIGSFGATGLFSVLLLKFLALAQLSGWDRVCGLLLMPTLGKWAITFSAFAYPYVRPTGMGRAFKDKAGPQRFALATGITSVACLILMGLQGLMLMGGIWLITLGLGNYARSRLGGFTGDVYGAVNEVGETFTLFFILALTRFLPGERLLP